MYKCVSAANAKVKDTVTSKFGTLSFTRITNLENTDTVAISMYSFRSLSCIKPLFDWEIKKGL